MSKSRIWCSAGHQIINNEGTGAHAVTNNKRRDEAVMARIFVNEVARKLWSKYKVNTITDSDTDSFKKVLYKVESWFGPRSLALDIHFNAFHNKKSRGCEVFVDDNADITTINAAKMIVDSILKSTHIPPRTGKITNYPGVKYEHESQHKTLAFVSVPNKAVKILVELGFITNSEDMFAYDLKFDKLTSAFMETQYQIYKMLKEKRL